MTNGSEPLLLPALRGMMGDWVYYVSAMSMGEVAIRVSVIDDIHSNSSLKEWLQRRLTDNSRKITEYLLSQQQRFFNAIVVGTYGGSPEWHDMSVTRRGTMEIPEDIEGRMGLLELRGDERLFAIDGQHRVEGIKKAVRMQRALEREIVCTIFVKGVVANERALDPEGYQRTRRLFSTLNRYAKPVRKPDIIALDEDDIVAIVTRRLLEEHPLLVDKVETRGVNSLSPTDRRHLTTLVTLYDVMDVVLRDCQRGWKDYKRWRPSEQDVEKYYGRAEEYWDSLCRVFVSLRELRDSSPEEEIAGKYRSPNGGTLLFRPVGMMLIGRVVADLRSVEGMALDAAIDVVGLAPTDVAESPWTGLLWDSTNRRMLTAKENQRVARRLLFCALGGDLSRAPFKTTERGVRKELAGVLNMDPAEVSLPRYSNPNQPGSPTAGSDTSS